MKSPYLWEPTRERMKWKKGLPREDTVHSLSHVWLSVTPWTVVRQVPLSSIICWSLLKLMSIETVMLFNHLILFHHLLLLSSIFLIIKVFSNESSLCTRRPKYWSFSISINSSNEYSGFISFRIDWFDFLAGQVILNSVLQYHNSNMTYQLCP